VVGGWWSAVGDHAQIGRTLKIYSNIAHAGARDKPRPGAIGDVVVVEPSSNRRRRRIVVEPSSSNRRRTVVKPCASDVVLRGK
jgi:hypothetical protein